MIRLVHWLLRTYCGAGILVEPLPTGCRRAWPYLDGCYSPQDVHRGAARSLGCVRRVVSAGVVAPPINWEVTGCFS